jgi:hypothetical protein
MTRRLISRPWTEEEDKLLLALLQQRRPLSFIGVRLRRSTGAVNSRRGLLLARQRRAAESPEKR